jgi:hypothetical protein
VTQVVAHRRPLSVTLPGYLLMLVAVLIVVDGLVGVAPIGAFGEATNNAYSDAGVANSARPGEAVQADLLVALAIDVVLAGAFLALGLHRVADLGGRRVARIVTWVLAGVGGLCFGLRAPVPAIPQLVLVWLAIGVVRALHRVPAPERVTSDPTVH